MKLSRPKVITWWIAVILGVVGILAILMPIPSLSGVAVWLIAAGFILLVLATALNDL
jgi:nicotinamide riboside transporter PnuC